MPTEVLVFILVVFAVAVILLWRSRRGGSGGDEPMSRAPGDRPEPSISNESGIGPHRDLGRPFHVDHGERSAGDPDPGARASGSGGGSDGD
jgi:hypothetical protein